MTQSVYEDLTALPAECDEGTCQVMDLRTGEIQQCRSSSSVLKACLARIALETDPTSRG